MGICRRFWCWLTKYKLGDEEFDTWLVICAKLRLEASDLLTEEESILVDKIYNKFYTDGCWISAIEGPKKATYIKYEEIKKKVYH